MDSKTAQNAQAVYLATKVNMASREQLLLITYDVGIRACKNAESTLAVGNIEDTNRNVQKAQNVIRELMVTLNVETGGEVAKNLMKLYDFMYLLLVEANVRKETEKIATVRGMLEELKETWEEAIVKLVEENKSRVPVFPVPSGKKFEPQMIPSGGLNIAG